MVKDSKHRTRAITAGGEDIQIKANRKTFTFVTSIQDEVHRYAISYHRNIKSKGALASLLDLVPGIGEVRRKELLKHFGSLKKMKEATYEELTAVLPDDIASNLFSYLKEI